MLLLTIPFVFFIALKSSAFVASDNLGVYSGLSPLFYVSLIVLIGLVEWRVYSEEPGRYLNLLLLLVLQILLLSVGFWVGGVGSSSSNVGSYLGYFGVVTYVTQHGLGSVIPLSAELGWWPSATSFHAILLLITGTDTSAFATQVIIISRVAYGVFDALLVYVVARAFKPNNTYMPTLAVLLYVSGDYFVPAWFQDTGFAYTLFLLIAFYLVFMKKQRYMISIVLFGAFVLSNFYASLILLGLIVVRYLLVRDSKHLLMYSTILLAWTIIGFPSIFGAPLANYYLLNLLNFGFLSSKLIGALTYVSPSHYFIAMSQIGLSVLFLGGGVASLLYVHLKRIAHSGLNSLMWYALGLGFIGTLAAPGFGPNPIEGLERAFLFLFPLLTVMIAYCGGTGRKFLILGIIPMLLLPLTIITTYGGVTPTYASSKTFAAADFAQSHWANNLAIGLEFPAASPTGGGAFFFTNGSLQLHYGTVYLNYSEILKLTTGAGPPKIGSLSHFLMVDSEIYLGSSQTYSSFAKGVYGRYDIVFSNPDTQYYLI